VDRPFILVTGVAWPARTPPARAWADILVGACDAADCTNEPWSAPIPNGGAPALAAGRRYLQARATLRSDTTRETELERLEIEYRRPAT
ncbi:MAG: hypothetical protein ACTHU0_28130, partial [Kofleriaceae bacterium]